MSEQNSTLCTSSTSNPKDSVPVTESNNNEFAKICETIEEKIIIPKNEKMRSNAYPIIVDFVNEIWTMFGSKKKVTPLALYYRLLKHVQVTDTVSVDRIIDGFRVFFTQNPKVITENNLFSIQKESKIEYSKSIYIDIQKFIFKSREDKDTLDAISRHLASIDTIINPTKQKMELLQKTFDTDDSPESKFVGNMMNKTYSSLNTSAENPMAALAGLFSGGGALSELLTGIKSGVANNTLNPEKLLASMFNQLGSLTGASPDQSKKLISSICASHEK